MSATINHNKIQNGVEIRFSVRPPEEDLTWLHSNGYRWSMRQKVWYRKYSESDYNKAMTRFGAGSNTGAGGGQIVAPPPPKPHTQSEILQSGGPALDKLYKFACMTLHQFFDAKIDHIYIPNREPYMWDAKKAMYAQMLPKRKRPDYYPYEAMLHKIQEYVLAEKLIIPLGAIFSLQHFYKYTKSAFDYLLKNYPFLALAEDYEKISHQVNSFENAYKEEYDKWQAIREKYFKVGQPVWVKENKTGKSEQWKVTKLSIMYYPGQICSLIEIERGGGYIIFMGEHRLSNVYLEDPKENPSAKVFTELLPELEAKQAQPENTHEIEKAKARLRLLKLKLSLTTL